MNCVKTHGHISGNGFLLPPKILCFYQVLLIPRIPKIVCHRKPFFIFYDTLRTARSHSWHLEEGPILSPLFKWQNSCELMVMSEKVQNVPYLSHRFLLSIKCHNSPDSDQNLFSYCSCFSICCKLLTGQSSKNLQATNREGIYK